MMVGDAFFLHSSSANGSKEGPKTVSAKVKCRFSPPGWVFPVVWSILYVLMGVSLYLVWASDAPKEQKTAAFVVFGISLLLNFLWSPIFFAARGFLAAFVVLVLLWLSVIGVILAFSRIKKTAGLLQLPYLLWVTFAGYLNLGVYLLNK